MCVPHRTSHPCGGMSKGGRRTAISNGRQVPVTWHLGYPHKGERCPTNTRSDGMRGEGLMFRGNDPSVN